MENISLKSTLLPSVTILPNSFIDEYMVDAPGDYVKIYLLLLRFQSSGQKIVLEDIADRLEFTVKMVKRAINFWQDKGLLEVENCESVQASKTSQSYNSGSSVHSIFPADSRTPASGNSTLPMDSRTSASGNSALPMDSRTSASGNSALPVDSRTPASGNSALPVKSGTADASPHHIPVKKNRTPIEIDQFRNNTDFEFSIIAAEGYTGKTLTATDLNSFLYIREELHFSSELFDYLIEYCVSRGKTSTRYIETVAINWYEEGIDTVAKAKAQSEQYTRNTFAVMKAFGQNNRNPGSKELEYIQQWNDMGFSEELIVEACNRTLIQTHQASFPYAHKILTDWFQFGVKTLDDVKKLTREHFEKNAEQYRKDSQSGSSASPNTTAGNTAPSIVTAKPNSFHNLHQRGYDYDDLQAKLLDQ